VIRFWHRLNPTLRGFLILVLIAIAIVALNLYVALLTVWALLRIAFLLAIAFFVYVVWREHRSEIATWPGHSRFALYGGALLIVADIGAYLARGVPGGVGAAAFLGTLVLSAFAMWRAWRDQRTYT
jgi:uncharacterized membrane protein